MKPHARSHIEELAHLHVDGAFDRRELLRRVACVTGSLAAAAMALESVGLPAPAADEALCTCPDDVRVPEDAQDLDVMHQVEFPRRRGHAVRASGAPETRRAAVRDPRDP
jgi:hypothetical protein